MKKQGIVKTIRREGEVGVSTSERYIDVYEKIVYDGLELAQLICYVGMRKLWCYFLDENNDGYWFDFDGLPTNTQMQIENAFDNLTLKN